MVNFFDDNNLTPTLYVEQISENVDMYPEYTDAGRFHVSTIEEGEWINYHLKIVSMHQTNDQLP